MPLIVHFFVSLRKQILQIFESSKLKAYGKIIEGITANFIHFFD